MLNVTIDLSQIDRAAEMWKRFPKRLQRSLGAAMKRSLVESEKEIKNRVPVRSGTLRRSFNADYKPTPASSGLGWIGKLGSNLIYARYQEFGFEGTENVKAHTRTVVFGRTVSPFTVPAYSRHVSYKGHPYARPGLAAAAPKIVDEHQQAIQAVLNAKNWGEDLD